MLAGQATRRWARARRHVAPSWRHVLVACRKTSAGGGRCTSLRRRVDVRGVEEEDPALDRARTIGSAPPRRHPRPALVRAEAHHPEALRAAALDGPCSPRRTTSIEVTLPPPPWLRRGTVPAAGSTRTTACRKPSNHEGGVLRGASHPAAHFFPQVAEHLSDLWTVDLLLTHVARSSSRACGRIVQVGRGCAVMNGLSPPRWPGPSADVWLAAESGCPRRGGLPPVPPPFRAWRVRRTTVAPSSSRRST